MGPWFEWTMIKFETDEQIISDSDRIDDGHLPPYFKTMNIHPRSCASSVQMTILMYMPLSSHVKKETKNLTQSSHSGGEKSGIKYLFLIINQCCELCQLIHLASMFLW